MAIADITNYILTHKSQYSLDALVEELRRAGYPEAEIQQAMTQERAGGGPDTQFSAPSFWMKAGQWLLGLVGGVALILLSCWLLFFVRLPFSFFRISGSGFIQILFFSLLSLVVPVAVYISMRKRSPYVARGFLSAVVLVFGILVLLMFVFLFIFGGRMGYII